MGTLRAWLQRLAGMFGKERRDNELAQELESHLQMHVDDNLRAGMTPDESRRQALLKLGGVEQSKEIYRDRRGLPWLEILLQDVRFGVRMLRKNPGFTAAVILTLALGIGATAAMFSVVNAVLLKPLPFPQPDRIVRLVDTSPAGNGTTTTVSKFMVWREQTDALQDIAAYDFAGPGVNLTSGDTPEQIRAIHVSADYFRLFGASATIGRTFTADEDRPGGPKLVVITNGLWRRRFAADSNLVGKTIDLGGEPHVVTGVLSPSFTTDPAADVYLPMQADPNSAMTGNSIFVAARMKPGITLAQAKAAMKLAAERYRRKFPETIGPNETATAIPMLDTIVGDIRMPLLVLAGAVVFLLLIACANVANLQLARSTTRKHEMAVRVALGARRKRVIRQLLTESLLLSLAGGALGLLFGHWGVRALLANVPAGVVLTNPDRIPRIGEHGSAVVLDWRVLAFTFLAAVLTGILFGLFPAFQVTRSDANVALRESASRGPIGSHQNQIRSALVITEIALTLMLLVGASMMIRTFLALRAVNPGFDGHDVLTMEMSFAGSRFEKTAAIAQVVRVAEQRIENIPGVAAAAYTNSLPLEIGMGLSFVIEGRPALDFRDNAVPQWREVSPHFFDVFRIPLLRGRMFSNSDDGVAPLVALINQAMAEKYWPNEDPVGRRITIAKGMDPATDEPPRQIIGVIADFRNVGLDHTPVPTVYLPVSQVVDGLTALMNRSVPMTWVIRTKVEPHSLSPEIQRELRIATGGLPVARIRSMNEVTAQSTQGADFDRALLAIFAGIGLILAAIGIYGVMAYSVQQRTQEIGIRMALGALPAGMRNMIVLTGMRLSLIGMGLGLAASLALTQVMTRALSGVKANDYYAANVEHISRGNLAGLGFAVLLLGVIALVAAYIPARRASRMDPMVALRYE